MNDACSDCGEELDDFSACSCVLENRARGRPRPAPGPNAAPNGALRTYRGGGMRQMVARKLDQKAGRQK